MPVVHTWAQAKKKKEGHRNDFKPQACTTSQPGPSGLWCYSSPRQPVERHIAPDASRMKSNIWMLCCVVLCCVVLCCVVLCCVVLCCVVEDRILPRASMCVCTIRKGLKVLSFSLHICMSFKA